MQCTMGFAKVLKRAVHAFDTIPQDGVNKISTKRDGLRLVVLLELKRTRFVTYSWSRTQRGQTN